MICCCSRCLAAYGRRKNCVNSAQCLNYLRASGLSVCLLVNFGTAKATVKRIVHNY
ncbi:MAG: hypothetical protein HY525_15990 [Betaproteobacteria bacterium]|nr:hypothetical protein [Betaproteobacteria bacterium]